MHKHMGHGLCFENTSNHTRSKLLVSIQTEDRSNSNIVQTYLLLTISQHQCYKHLFHHMKQFYCCPCSWSFLQHFQFVQRKHKFKMVKIIHTCDWNVNKLECDINWSIADYVCIAEFTNTRIKLAKLWRRWQRLK